MNGWIEARHRCVDGSHTCARRHETFLTVDPKLNKAEGGNAGDKPPTLFQLIVLKYNEVLLQCQWEMVMDEQVEQDDLLCRSQPVRSEQAGPVVNPASLRSCTS